MYLSRVRPSSGSDQLRRLAQLAGGGQYRIHQALWKLFDSDPDADRDFIYRQEGQADELAFLVLSQRKPGTDDGLWRIQTKPYAPRLQTGQRLAFSIRINPVVKRRDDAGRQHRHDLVMNLKKNEPDSAETQAERVQLAAQRWLGARQSRYGFELAEGSVIGEAYRQWRFRGKGGNRISFSSIDCSGCLTVTDTARFESALMKGVGPAKAFGCGLLLIRPA
jgi:CRISPR system Cascade subunit CasE